MPELKGILLLGPTGVGKSPLGDLLEEKGLYGYRFLHFDFGRELRAIAKGALREDILPSERIFIRKVLEEGLLFEDEHFPLVEKIFLGFLKHKGARDEILIMNGLPRHVGQAQKLASRVNIPLVLVIEASFEEILERIHRNTGGDRQGRDDDYIELIYKKWQTYKNRTRPLRSYYQAQGAEVLKILVGRFTKPHETLSLLKEQLPCEKFVALFKG
ncbi:adenylate kinase family protein [Thermodesulfatator atlanticus]|uniref:adenylate kinase family protein n=1 Tax=Thermodesulfatator atlanticus TaxID=501497 RepID=UPI0003B568DC|nr:nucleoside monophosphate kinase [Thermodesulfatator atlanticus]